MNWLVGHLKNFYNGVTAWGERHKFWNYRVKVGGLQYRRYQYWQRETGNTDSPVTSSGCAYFHRANVFAPLLWLRKMAVAGPKLGKTRLPISIVTIEAAIGVFVAKTYTSSPQILLLVGAGVIYAICGTYVSFWAIDAIGNQSIRSAMSDVRNNPRNMLWVFIFMPIIWIVLILHTVLRVVVLAVWGTFVYLFDYDELALGYKFIAAINVRPKKATWLRPWTVALAGLATYLGFNSKGFRELLILTVVVIVTGMIFIIPANLLFTKVIAPWLDAKKQKRLEKRRQAMLGSAEFAAWLNARFVDQRTIDHYTMSELYGQLRYFSRVRPSAEATELVKKLDPNRKSFVNKFGVVAGRMLLLVPGFVAIVAVAIWGVINVACPVVVQVQPEGAEPQEEPANV